MNNSVESSWLKMLSLTANKYTSIPNSEWEKISSSIKKLYLKKNDYFIHTNDVPDKMAFIISGIFRVFYITEKGDEKTLVFRSKNDFLSAYSSFLENTKSRYSIQAISDSVLIYITLSEYKKLAQNHTCWKNLSGSYAERLFLEKEKRENSLLTLDATNRYLNFIKDFPQITTKIPNYMIASYLGVTPVALSRIINLINKNSNSK